MFGKKDEKPVEKNLQGRHDEFVGRRNVPGSVQTIEQPDICRPTPLEILKKRRAEKMRLIKQLDKEIEMLDHDITFIERYPQHGRVLEFIAARFSGEQEPGLKTAVDRSDLYR